MINFPEFQAVEIPSPRPFLWRVVEDAPTCLVDSIDGVTVASRRIVAYARPRLGQKSSSSTWSAPVPSGQWCRHANLNIVKFRLISASKMEVIAGNHLEVVDISPSSPVYTASSLLEMTKSEKVRWEIGNARQTKRRSGGGVDLTTSSPVISIGSQALKMSYAGKTIEADLVKSPFPVEIMLPPWEFSVLWEFAQSGNFSFMLGTTLRPCCFLRSDNGIFFLPFRATRVS